MCKNNGRIIGDAKGLRKWSVGGECLRIMFSPEEGSKQVSCFTGDLNECAGEGKCEGGEVDQSDLSISRRNTKNSSKDLVQKM